MTLSFGYNKVVQERVGIADTPSFQHPLRIFRILHLAASRSYLIDYDPPSRLLWPVLQRIADCVTRTARMDYRREVRLAYLQNFFGTLYIFPSTPGIAATLSRE